MRKNIIDVGFTVVCNECGIKQVFKHDDNPIGDNIQVSVTEDCGFQGCIVDSIDFYCSNCDNGIEL